MKLTNRRNRVWTWNGTQSLLNDPLIFDKRQCRRSVFPTHSSHLKILSLLLGMGDPTIRRVNLGHISEYYLADALTHSLLNGDRLRMS